NILGNWRDNKLTRVVCHRNRPSQCFMVTKMTTFIRAHPIISATLATVLDATGTNRSSHHDQGSANITRGTPARLPLPGKRTKLPASNTAAIYQNVTSVTNLFNGTSFIG